MVSTGHSTSRLHAGPVAATGGREAPGGWWGGLSVPKPPKGVADPDSVSCFDAVVSFSAATGSASACAVRKGDSA